MTYYIIYETTNLINGKKYRGAHITELLDDGYFGSGVQIKLAIEKYGKSNFSRDILYFAFDFDAMWQAERLLVDEVWVSRDDTYNLALGGRIPNRKGLPMSETAKEKRAIKMARHYSDLAYCKKLSQIQKNKPAPSETARLNMSKSGKGKKKSEQHANNISQGLKTLFNDPVMRAKRRIQSQITNGRQEVRDKISNALKGIQRSDETKLKCKMAARARCQDPTYLQKQSVSQSRRWETDPATWWNNGVSSKRSVLCPGPEWLPGRITFGTWWTNGTQSVMSKACPGPDWIPGRKMR
jgi:hypothetical protein